MTARSNKAAGPSLTHLTFEELGTLFDAARATAAVLTDKINLRRCTNAVEVILDRQLRRLDDLQAAAAEEALRRAPKPGTWDEVVHAGIAFRWLGLDDIAAYSALAAHLVATRAPKSSDQQEAA